MLRGLSNSSGRLAASFGVSPLVAPIATVPAAHYTTGTDFKAIHQQLNANENIVGVHGGDHAVYHAVSEVLQNRQLHRLREGHAHVITDEYHVPELYEHLKDPKVQERWAPIVSLDPYGMDSGRPTISATPANMEIPEIMPSLHIDGKIVNENRSISVIKAAIDPVWNLPAMAELLKVDEGKLRFQLSQWTQIEEINDTKNNLFLPAIGGTTVYLFGDLGAITDPERKVALRVHDECNGSDVFGTDICTCRPYLTFAIEEAVKTAQDGGLGVIVYYRKEGRALGEVTKFRVYNSRKYQKGGDRAETYFAQTENIAGVVDARVQELMPDPLHWLGISRIDYLCSMSKDKYDAIVGAGIEVVDRVALPEDLVPDNAQVEINAKISSGYLGFQPKKDKTEEQYLMTLEAVRERSSKILDAARAGETPHFEIDQDKAADVVSRVSWTIRSRYPDLNVPPHSRLRQFEVGGVDRLRLLDNYWQSQKVNAIEQARRRIDLVMTSVLVDAGAGPAWKYRDHASANSNVFARSEGLAIASYDMFRSGMFAGDRRSHVADADGLNSVSREDFIRGFQIDENSNPLVGVDGRLQMLRNLGAALQASPEIFGEGGNARPGHLLDYIMSKIPDNQKRVSVRVLWQAVIDGLTPVFPDPTGMHLGDCWPHPALQANATTDLEGMVPFHKLSQWLTYSLIEPLEEFGLRFVDTWLLTGLAEYRNGGLLIDSGLVVPKEAGALDKTYEVSDTFIVEWRALTVALLDELAKDLWEDLGTTERKLPMAKLLEGGTWRAGREIALEKREDGGPPVNIRSDGNVF